MNAVAAMHTVSPPVQMSAPVMMSLSQTNSTTENLQAFSNTNIKLMDTSPPVVSPSSSGTGTLKDEHAASSPGSSTSAEDSPSKREPDSDAIKMFVGQVPKTMDESELREMFSKYGDISQLNVLRDKATGAHRGCCFVTFYTRKAAIMAQDELHGRHTLAGMHHPIQMKPADNEKKNVEDRKLFIGMISKKLAENDIRQLFAPFGSIEDCMILRDTSGVSRGCAFVTYAVRQSALNAIQHMHHAQTMEGCSSPLVVKFADTQKDKGTKILPTNNNIITANPFPTGALPAGVSPQYLALLQQSLGGNPMGGNLAALPTSPLTNIDMALQNYHNIQNLQNMGMLTGQNLIGIPAISGTPLSMTRSVTSPTNGHAYGLNSIAGAQKITQQTTNAALSQSATGIQTVPTQPQPPTSMAGGALTAASMLSAAGAGFPATHTLGGGGGLALQQQQNAAAAAAAHQAAAAQQVAAAPTMAGPAAPGQHSSNPAIDAALSQAYSGIAQYTASFPHAYAPTALAPDTPAGKQTEGPDGANLFIYHLPQEFTDMDLLQAFLPFGNVVSSKVFIDKQTNLSKCFGFVSFDNPISAQTAIQTMNGYQIGMKRLKVQLKRPKNENKPY